jgi:hypothetical protein
MLPVNIQNDDIANTIHNGNLQTDITFQWTLSNLWKVNCFLMIQHYDSFFKLFTKRNKQ